MRRKLVDSIIKNAKPKPDGKPTYLTDGGGLYLYVTATGKSWRYNYRIDGKTRTLYIGIYDEIGLKDARQRHQEAREQLARGVDPSNHKRMMKASQTDSASNSFEAIAREWFGRSKLSWSESHTVRTISYLERDVFPWIGKININQVTTGDVIKTVQRVEARGAGGCSAAG